ncbi:MAG: SrfA family protein [Aeromonas sobria]|uniref:SrfA family protein n=1 Tax=Aeromonas sobria TaxID=646 RepID=UPI003F371D55
MQDSIQGPLLRSGHNSAFKALGETGFPVYRMASQLRETIRRLDTGHDLARHLAIPQNHQGGDRTDWYSSFAGDVIPWNSATEFERAAAYSQLESFKLAVLALSEQLLTTDNKDQGGDKRVFASLLKQVVNFPDQDFVYLVDGVLVITFWGFVHDNDEQRDPMHWLKPVSPSLTTPGVAARAPVAELAPACEIVPTTGAVPAIPMYAQPVTPTIQSASWWSRWRWSWLFWPLLLLALLALLLFGLRSCAPSFSLPGVSPMGLPILRDSAVAVPSSGQALPAAHGPADVAATVPSRASEQHTTVDSVALASGAPLTPPSAPLASGEEPVSASPPQASMPGAAADLEPPTLPPASPPSTDPAPNNSAPQDPVPKGKELTIPPTMANGPAQFLDGDWKVNGGIQDTQTGKPLQLQYSFKEGEGRVSLRQSNGVECRGAASGVMKDGQLSINNLGQAECADGSSYMIPQIECKPGTDNGTDCVGRNEGEKQFPIKMRQKNP